MNQFITQFRNLDNLIRGEYQRLELRCLFEVKFDAEHSLSFFNHKLDGLKPIHSFNFFKNYNEISFISDDLKYFTSLTYLLLPFINNLNKENKTYFQKVEDKRYLSYSNILFQTFYNYWDRIGDLIYCFLKTPLKEKQVYFYSVLQNLDNEIKNSEYYLKLNNLYEEKLLNLFRQRKEIVHYIQLSAEFYSNTFLNYDNKQKLEEIQNYKQSLPELFKSNIEYTFQGFEFAVRLINQKGIHLK